MPKVPWAASLILKVETYLIIEAIQPYIYRISTRSYQYIDRRTEAAIVQTLDLNAIEDCKRLWHPSG